MHSTSLQVIRSIDTLVDRVHHLCHRRPFLPTEVVSHLSHTLFKFNLLPHHSLHVRKLRSPCQTYRVVLTCESQVGTSGLARKKNDRVVDPSCLLSYTCLSDLLSKVHPIWLQLFRSRRKLCAKSVNRELYVLSHLAYLWHS